MRIVNAKIGSPIHIGRVGENLATKVVFNIDDLVKIDPIKEGTVQLVIQKDGEIYFIDEEHLKVSFDYTEISDPDHGISKTFISGGEVEWIVIDENTSTAGKGQCELFYFVDDARIKSIIYDTVVTNSIDADEATEAPEYASSWVEEVLSKAEYIEGRIVDAEEAATSASESADAARISAGAAEESAAAAGESAASASESATAARDSATAAGNSATAAAQSETNASGYANDASASSIDAAKSAANALFSEEKASQSEQNALQSEFNASRSESNALDYANDAAESKRIASEMAAAADEDSQNAENFAGQAYDYREETKAAKEATLIARDNAVQASTEASASQTKALQSEQNAKASETNAAASATSASQSEVNAAESEAKAAESASAAAESAEITAHPPYMNTESGNWMVWNNNADAYEDSGIRYSLKIVRSYESIAAMNADLSNMKDGDLVIIASEVSDEENSQLYVHNGTSWVYLSDLSGLQGVGIASIEKPIYTGNEGTTDVYTIHLTDGRTTTFEVYNGFDGEGAGDMLESDYDKDKEVLNAGGIVPYVTEATKITVRTWSMNDLN